MYTGNRLLHGWGTLQQTCHEILLTSCELVSKSTASLAAMGAELFDAFINVSIKSPGYISWVDLVLMFAGG